MRECCLIGRPACRVGAQVVFTIAKDKTQAARDAIKETGTAPFYRFYDMFRMGVFYNGQNPDESVYYMENMPLTSLCPRYCCLKAIDCNALTLIDVKLTEWKCKEPSPYAP